MKWLILSFSFLLCNCMNLGQDFVFPDDEDLSHVSGNNGTITERIPVSAPNECPENMFLYPGAGNRSTWFCDCRSMFLYFPRTDSCHEAYRQGPCPPEYYVILPKDEVVPQCAKNPCLTDGMVQYNNTCHRLRTTGGPCASDAVLGVNETTFQLECMPSDIAPFIIIDAPPRACPPGSRRASHGICKKPV